METVGVSNADRVVQDLGGIILALNMDIILYIAGAIITLTAVIKIFADLIEKSVKRVSKDAINAAIDELNEHFVSRLEDVDSSLRVLLNENRRNDKAVRTLTLKNSAARIHEGYSHYMRRGSITTFGLANLEEIFSIYEDQGGNGHTKLCMEQIRQLPIIDMYPLPPLTQEKESEDERQNKERG